jgi:hypothetical protein
MNFIKKIYEGKVDEDCKLQFRRFSKGEFTDRALVDITKGKSLKIKTSFEYANEFVKFLASTIEGKVKITGGIITKQNLEFPFEVGKKQFAGVKTYLIDNEFTKDQLLNLMNKHNEILYLLSFKTLFGELKIKVKAPKAGKPGKDEEKPKVNFCIFVTDKLDFVKEFAYDVDKDFKKLFIKHTILVKEIIIPDEYKNDFLKARLNARRKGKIIRYIDIDGKTEEKEFDFEV